MDPLRPSTTSARKDFRQLAKRRSMRALQISELDTYMSKRVMILSQAKKHLLMAAGPRPLE